VRLNRVFVLLFSVLLVSHGWAEQPRFKPDVRAIFVKHCFNCHGDKGRKGELDLRTPASIRRGSESGPIIEPNEPDKSLLYELVREREMPPEGKNPLSESELETIRAWIADGARFENDPDKTASQTPDQHDVLPILQLRCTVCHGRQKQEGALDLRTRASILKGGKSGPAMVLGNPDESLLLKKILAKRMPPLSRLASASVKPMMDKEVQIVTKWIRDGAPEKDIPLDVAGTEPDPLVSDEDRKFWAFQRPIAADVPIAAQSTRARNAVDAFILDKLSQNGMQLSPEADRIALLRRATFDLHGLPPTVKQHEQFLRDERPGAYERLIDRLLASPRYGEKWGRYWLDVAGYSDSEGGQHADRVRPEAYRYRDYVIRSLNADKPYDRFLVEQIAGDELTDYRNAKVISDEIYNNLVATGFLRMAPDGTYAGITAFVPDRLEIIDDQLEILTSSVMGLTLRCARCHSHKFDPLPQRDYYRMAAIFKGAWDEHDWLEPTKQRYLPFVRDDERRRWADRERKLDDEVARLKAELEQTRSEFAAKHAADKPDDDALKKLEPGFAKALKETEGKIKSVNGQRRPQPRVRALWDRGEPTTTYILKRGDYLNRGRPVGPGVPSVLTDGKTPFHVEPPNHGTKSTGRRLAFARWLTQPQHPLTARVVVNRIWKHHFGAGIVTTLDNFGVTGSRASHPELLDWLAVKFVEQGWNIKALHRLMMNSSTYRQSSNVSARHLQLDPTNRLWSRMPIRRLEGEVIRDSLLAVAGRLDHRLFGPPDPLDTRDDGLVVAAEGKQAWRRTIFVLQRRTTHLTILDNFDLPQMNPNCVERSSSIVAPQALHLLNNKRVYDLSRFFADRIVREAGDNPDAQIEHIYLVALGRSPTASEKRIAAVSLERLTKEWMRKLKGKELAVDANVQLWIRAAQPDKLYENDLISVWSKSRELRYGLVQFDVSDLPDVAWKAAHLELGVLNQAPVKQSARLIPPGIANETWSSFHATKSDKQQPLDSFGRIDVSNGEGTVGSYVRSDSASESDLALLSEHRKNKRIALVLVADEDGTAYGRDWDDGSRKGNVPRLIVRIGEPDRREAARRALENLCHAIMNSAAFLYID
jgi:hypothetical protein